MTTEFKVEITKTDPDIVTDAMKKALYKSMVKMKELAIRKAPIDLGGLRAGIKLEPNSKTSDNYTLSDGVEYGVHMEYGTRAHWVPIAPLIDWARRHGGDEGFAYAIQRKISQVGVNAHPFFRPALYETQSIWIPLYFSKLGDLNV